MTNSVYKDFILKNIPKIITQIDRDENSTTYGSCDRNHWHLKIRDFTSAILQQSGLALAIIYDLNFEGNIYYENINIKKWAKATVYYWAKIQLKDGSYNEYYPWEHGFPPTAFSLYGSCEIYKRLGMNDNNLISKFNNTGKYLINHVEEKAFNQEIASIAGLYSLYTITKEKWVLDGLNVKLERVMSLQSSEGWFPEYGGADLGYLSVALDMLSEYFYMSNDARVKEPLNNVIEFIQYFVHPDATVGGEYGSRNTTYFLPNGLEVMAEAGNKAANAIKNKLYGNTSDYNYFMDSVDDRYFSHYLMHSFLRAMEKESKFSGETSNIVQLPYEYNHEKYFEESGLVTVRNNNFYAVVSLRKGGLIKVFKNDEEVFIDCGYRVDYGKGSVAATNWLDPSYKVNCKNKSCSVSGNFNKIGLKVSTPILHIGLRVVAFILGNKIISLLKKKIIFVDKHCDILFSREIKLEEDEIIIHDKFKSPSDVNITRASNMSLRHVASGKFYMKSDLLMESGYNYYNVKELELETKFNIRDNKYNIEKLL